MAFQGIDGVSNETAIERIGRLIDLSHDLKREDGTTRALEWCDALERRGMSNSEAALLAYFRANAWANRQNEKHRNPAAAWAWEQPELQEQVLHLRRATNQPAFEELSPLRRCQILTNLANQLNTVGRFVEALEYWNRALAINSRFGMALGNRGYGLGLYARAHYDPGHQAVFLSFAHKDLTAALSSQAEYEGAGYNNAKAFFQSARTRVETAVDIAHVSKTVDLDNHKMGASEEERQYRCWCLQSCLFLNPLNDLGTHSIAGRDVLMLPNYSTPTKETPTLIGFFNQMKQEFVSARWLLYEGVHAGDVHFSDRGVSLYNTLDYPSYALAVEKVKAAYRIAYSIFDKIGFFLNDYMILGVAAKKVYFKSIWYQKYELDNRVLRSEFEQSENWPFRGLFWLSKDLFEEDFRAVTEPDAQALFEIRNHLEHKYLKVHETIVPQSGDAESPALGRTDRLAYSVQRRDFEAKTLRLLRLSRAGLIYLSLGMHREEGRRGKERGETRVVPMSLDVWEDEWKR